jgi:Porin PorA
MTGRGRSASVASYALVFFGLLLLFFALLVRFYAFPRLAKAPEDQFSTTVADGSGTYFSRGKLEQIPGAQLRSTRVVRGDVAASDDRTAVWDTFVTLTDASDASPISASEERVTFDRVTAEPVHCCNEKPDGHEGIVLKFPFDVEQRTYQFWDGTLKRAFPLQFQAAEDIRGVETYRFEQHVPPSKVQDLEVPGSIVGQPDVPNVQTEVFYSNTRTIWVEPASGTVVKGQEAIRQTLRTIDGQDRLTTLDATLAYNEETVRRQAESAAEARSSLNLLKTILPVGGSVLGVLLIAAGLVLASRRPAGPDRRDAGIGLVRDAGGPASAAAESKPAHAQSKPAAPAPGAGPGTT